MAAFGFRLPTISGDPPDFVSSLLITGVAGLLQEAEPSFQWGGIFEKRVGHKYRDIIYKDNFVTVK